MQAGNNPAERLRRFEPEFFHGASLLFVRSAAKTRIIGIRWPKSFSSKNGNWTSSTGLTATVTCEGFGANRGGRWYVVFVLIPPRGSGFVPLGAPLDPPLHLLPNPEMSTQGTRIDTTKSANAAAASIVEQRLAQSHIAGWPSGCPLWFLSSHLMHGSKLLVVRFMQFAGYVSPCSPMSACQHSLRFNARIPPFRGISSIILIAVTHARFASLQGFRSALTPSRPRPFRFSNRVFVTSEHLQIAGRIRCGR